MYMVIIVCECKNNSGLNLEQHDSVLPCALQWSLSIVDTPGTAENVLISEVPSF